MFKSVALLVWGGNVALSQAIDSFPFSRLPFKDVIPTNEIPLFITITIDDAVTPYTSYLFSKIARTTDPDTGCNLKATFYVSIEGNTKCEYVQGLRKGGHEIATHTLDHVGIPSPTQIQGAVDWLAYKCGIPIEEMRGFRTPFLNWDDSTLQNLHQLGFLYDSSIGPTDHTANSIGTNHTWPFTLEQQSIDQFKNGKPNIQISPAPGLWEIPMWSLYDSANQAVIPMDYPNPRGGNSVITDLIDPNFLKRYNGNRAPFGLFFHAAWLVANGEALATWIQEIMDAYDDVFFVTSFELLEWMRNPVPVSQYVHSCPDQKECFAPRATGCLFGTFNGDTCECDCMTPYCKGPDGACSQSTNCPIGPTTPVTPPVSPPVTPYDGPGCCSQTFKSCDVTWCGTTEAQCNACAGELKWLANGPLTNCMGNWAWGCSRDNDCCDGLVCSNSACTPGERAPTLVEPPVEPPTPVDPPIVPPTEAPVDPPIVPPTESPVDPPVEAPIEPTVGCCSQTFKSCDVTWCGTTEAQCNACTGELKWLANGPLTNCMGNWAWGCSRDDDCCDGLMCSDGSCTPGERAPTSVEEIVDPLVDPPVDPPIVPPTEAPVEPPVEPPVTVTGCCSQDALKCNVNWCGTTAASCKACGNSYTWLANGPPAVGSCVARWGSCTLGGLPCCAGTFCDVKSQWYASCEPDSTW